METLKHDDAERQRFRALVLANVRFRFVLSREDFERRVLNLARQRAPAGVLPSLFAGRLSLDDYYLATACAGGDEEAWAELIAAHRGFVHRFARRILREPEASDLAAELIADLWQHRKIERYEGRSSLRTWLGTVVAHAAVNAGKAARTRARHAHRATAFQRSVATPMSITTSDRPRWRDCSSMASPGNRFAISCLCSCTTNRR